MTDLTMTTTRTLPAPPRAVFDAWLDPAMLARFMKVPTGEGTKEARVTNDPVEGGGFEIVMFDSEGAEIPHRGTYLEITPHSRLRFTWDSPHSLPESEVTIELAEAEGGTKLTLTQVKFRSEQARDGHQQGWSAILDRLAPALAGAPA